MDRVTAAQPHQLDIAEPTSTMATTIKTVVIVMVIGLLRLSNQQLRAVAVPLRGGRA
jgi:hypothetical protein